MNSLSNKQNQHGIVRVSCGRKRGTAFRVSGGKLLTARHVVEEYFLHRVPVLVYYDDVPERYDAVSVDATKLMVDVAMLTPTVIGQYYSHLDKAEELPLLSIEYKYAQDMHLTIIGYPEELGEGASQIRINVKNHSEIKKRKYDMLTVREDFFDLRMFNGFSGSPVVTEGGYVIGVVSTEIYGKLGYCSIKHIEKRLKEKGIKEIDIDWQSNDDTQYSRKKSKEQIEEAVAYAGSRYHRNNHQKNEELMKLVESFCVYMKTMDYEKRLQDVEQDIANNPYIIKSSDYTQGDFINLQKYIDELIANPAHTVTLVNLLRKHRRTVELNYPRYETATLKYLRISGVAGTGKTHFSCHIAETFQDKAYVYLLFGSQFNTSEHILGQLSKLLPFGGNSKDILHRNLSELDERMKQTKQNAVFIIDALNEGAGEFFWKDSLRLLTKELGKFKRIKLIVTIRDPFVSKITGGLDEKEWVKYHLTGFSSYIRIDAAIQSYFEEYGIDPSLVKGFKKQFKLPLFLLIFCQSFGYLTEEERKNLSRIVLFKRYLKARNADVAERVNEDEKREITWDMMDKLAWRSVEKWNSGVVSRKDAREIADSICKRELWAHNLLNALLKENLLMETLSKDDEDMVMFEFENIAEIMKANSVLHHCKTAEEILQLLDKTADYLEAHNGSAAKFENMVTALISMWDKKRKITDIDAFVTGRYKHLLTRAVREYPMEGNGLKLQKWINGSKSEYDPLNLLHQLDNKETELFVKFDMYLHRMTMSERDEKWTISVNDLFEDKSSWHYLTQMLFREREEQERLVKLLVWMLTTSFPDSRQLLIGLLYRLFLKNENMILSLLAEFDGCNDHYLLNGLYCAVYGYTLRTKNHDLVKRIAEYVKGRYYSDVDGKVVADIDLRQWTLMILDRAEYLHGGSNYFSTLHLPFRSGLPSKKMLKNEIPEGYFGEGKGAAFLYYSLNIGSDFYRYTLGGNSFEDSHEFFEVDEQGVPKALKLPMLLQMIAPIIKNDFKYSRTLDEYDAYKYSRDRHHNATERIGKKYQWLALWRIYAQLCDNYWFKDDDNYPDPIELTRKVWPWMTQRYDRIDPTMPTLKEIQEYARDLKFAPEFSWLKDHWVTDGKEWVDSVSTHPIVNPQYYDTKQSPWVLLYGFQSDKQEFDDENCNRLLYYNCCFVRERDAAKMSSWAAEKDFSGRWMEYHQDCIDFRWNEFPWSHSYKRLKRDEWVNGDLRNEYPCSVKVAYDEQLQEEVYGIVDTKDYHSFSAGMPSAELLETMNLYAAERGLIRRVSDDSLVAVSLSVLPDAGVGVLIKKDVLCEFMKQKRYILFCYISGIKEVSASNYHVVHSRKFSGCICLDAKGIWKTVQELRHVENG